ncbi:P27 family phage terminase small subunit [Myroides odoratimimus]|uniref:P27 family phage terminase small subunit n=1 Tax=Myroides odoratimimus TaxID=76832 RepID=UPI0025769DAC|nr:P27 family phage terminase small subunit [Myroides odoratimimus]MDM1514632.1 P27 family phage terminase small subunit [Myroides odoratimimus]MDM1535065.1 P27 family phage terminase small subunit [Myroides odoratimimus]MDM1674177.1 P27 family phage terminase small subunit [Myroides odoratimimus]
MKENNKVVNMAGELLSWDDASSGKKNKNLYDILDKLPAPIAKFNLSKDQKYWYKYFGEQLVSSGRLTKPDLVHLHRLATTIDYYIQAEAEINSRGFQGGLIQTFKGGATNVSGYVTVREKMIKDLDDLSKHFGFSFKDRSKLTEVKTSDPGQGDLFSGFLNQKFV